MAPTSRRQFLVAAAGTACAAAQPRRRPPNFIFLFADDMGYGDLGCYGHPTIRTPNLDRMAAEGMRFTSFYAAAPVCTPSRVGLLTGRYPLRAGQPVNLGPDSTGGLPLSEILIPQLLKPRGYKTMAIGKWHIGHSPKGHLPTNRGFDRYIGLAYSNDMIPPWVKTEAPLRMYHDAEPGESVTDQSRLTELYTREAVKFVRGAAPGPFFLYLPYAMPHLPISTMERFRGRSRAGLYGDVIETLDWSAGEILKTLKDLKIDGDTMVMFASDNGPWHNLPPRERQNGNEPWHTGTAGLLRGSKINTYEGGMRVPGIFRWPGMIPAGQVSAEPVATLDVLPTLVKAAGASLPADRVYDGSDLLPHLQGKAPSPRRELFYCRGRIVEAVRQGPWKYRFSRDPQTGQSSNSRQELYNLDVDPAEMYNVCDRYPDRAAALRTRIREFAAEVRGELADPAA
jgi:arylsulfatase A